jgi:N-acetylmuramoyl-L-alanine amidase
VQIAAVIALCGDICARHAIAPPRVLAHSDIAPSRKRDPGEKFPWMLLHRSGVGHCVEPAPIMPGPEFDLGDSGNAVQSFQMALRDYGYAVPTDGVFDQFTYDVVLAFQRHFRPERCDGKVDSSTLVTLRRLLESRNGRRYPQAAE